MKNVDSKLGSFFREQRLKAGLSQTRLARLLGYSTAQMVSNWETGLNAVPLDAISQMIQIFELATNQVVDIIIEDNRRYLLAKLDAIANNDHGKSDPIAS